VQLAHAGRQASMVTISEPFTSAAKIEHALTVLPSRRTVQALRSPSQPTCVPVRPKVSRSR
jgi:hypothetical protein